VDGYSALTRESGALYFPRITRRDPLGGGTVDTFPPCGAVAGVIARTDAARGVWAAPAGEHAELHGIEDLSASLRRQESETLHAHGVNCLRTFPGVGSAVWGARTMAGADTAVSEWKFLPVRRLSLFLEQSLYRGTKRVVFEPNDERLWSRIRTEIATFMNGLSQKGAFQGRSGRDFFVKCDSETTTAADIERGIVNIVVGFAPVRPAEFLTTTIQQVAG
jgi:phage tail sheath protein FI